jgi:hypothetical protein
MAFRLRDSVLRLLPALPNAMATACLIAFFCRRMTGAYRPILLPVIHQCLDIAAYDRLAGSFSERHDLPPVAGIN